MTSPTKTDKLTGILRGMKNALIAYSGGVDSTFLLRTALDALGKDNLLAVIASSETYPEHEKREALALCKELGAPHLLILTGEINDERFRSNPKERCYYCKSELFSKLKEIAREQHLEQVLDGSNADDVNDFRPGSRAKTEHGVRSPLQEAGLTKDEIRSLSKELGLSTWDKPSY
ncbi:MAG TPA: ATP-dependent sacrificial sulfur transferase LarE, partial [Candidatus Omnitrophota bacterium]|nr:ATP-dependent sacrificial sulfur transferase LarE [Candidatus Omnitrophota bacterium]